MKKCETCEYGYYEDGEEPYCEYWGMDCEDIEECYDERSQD